MAVNWAAACNSAIAKPLQQLIEVSLASFGTTVMLQMRLAIAGFHRTLR
jgi:hypothetical protein